MTNMSEAAAQVKRISSDCLLFMGDKTCRITLFLILGQSATSPESDAATGSEPYGGSLSYTLVYLL